MTIAGRIKRICAECGVFDDHPMHGQAVANGSAGSTPSAAVLASLDGQNIPVSAIAQLMHPEEVWRHMHCCAATGCRDCVATEATHAGLRGDELVAHLESGAVDHLTTSSGPVVAEEK